jgi:hypothetical protein
MPEANIVPSVDTDTVRQLALFINNLAFILHQASPDEEIQRITAGIVGGTQTIITQLTPRPLLFAANGDLIAPSVPSD